MKKLWMALFFVGITLLAFWKVIFHQEFTLLTGEDLIAAYFPWFDVAAYWLKKGVLLLWDPYVYSGKLFMGEPQPGLFYPLNWIFMLFRAPGGGASHAALEALFILDYFLAALFFYLLARSMELSRQGAALASIAFAYGGFSPQLRGYLNVLSGFVWMPLVFLAFRKALLEPAWRGRARFLLASGAGLALSFLPGHHIPPVHTGLLLFFYAAFMRIAGWRQEGRWVRVVSLASLAAVAGIAAALTVFQWLPSAGWAQQVFRWVGIGEPVKWGQKVPYSALQGAANINPPDALSMVLPYVSTNANLYVGGIVLFFAVVGLLFDRRRDSLFCAAGIFLYYFLSWGERSAIHGWVNTFIPGVWFARELFYYMIPFQLCLALLAGCGLDYLAKACSGEEDRVFKVFLRRAGWTIALLVLVSGALSGVLHLYKDLPLNHRHVTGAMQLAVYLAVLGILLYLLHTRRLGALPFSTIIVGLVLVDLTSHMSMEIEAKTGPDGGAGRNIQSAWKKPRVAEYLEELRRNEVFRVDDPDGMFPVNYGDVWRLESAMGHGATALVRYLDFRGTGWGPLSNASALLNLAYIPSRTPVPGMRKVFEDQGCVSRNPRAVPRVFAAARFRECNSPEDVLARLGSPLFAPSETVLLNAADLGKVPAAQLRQMLREEDGFLTSILDLRLATEKIAARAKDEAERHRIVVYQPPWGWTAGDEIKMKVSPLAAGPRCYMELDYYPAAASPSHLQVKVEGPDGQAVIPFDLAGAEGAAAEPSVRRRASVDLGLLQERDYIVALAIPDGCGARIDSIRFAGRPAAGVREPPGSVSLTSYKPNLMRMIADLKQPSFLVVSEINYPGWEARVDGKPAPVLTGNYVLRAVPVPEGRHAVELRFRPADFRWGLILSGLALALSGICWFLLRPRGRVSKTTGGIRASSGV